MHPVIRHACCCRHATASLATATRLHPDRYTGQGQWQQYCFANRRATRMKVLAHDGVGVWVALRRIRFGRISEQLDATQFRLLH